MADGAPVKVHPRVFEGLEEVRESGETNMFDRHAVAKIAIDYGYYATALFVEEQKDAYSDGIFNGFEPDDSITETTEVK